MKGEVNQFDWIGLYALYGIKLAALVYILIIRRFSGFIPMMYVAYGFIVDAVAFFLLRSVALMTKEPHTVIVSERQPVFRRIRIALIVITVLSTAVILVAWDAFCIYIMHLVSFCVLSIFANTGSIIVTDKGIRLRGAFIRYDRISKCEIIDRPNQGSYYPFLSLVVKRSFTIAYEMRFRDKSKTQLAFDYIQSRIIPQPPTPQPAQNS